MLRSTDFHFSLPSELIAQIPRRRGDSRLLVLSRHNGSRQHKKIHDLPELLSPGDCLVVNDTKVMPARLWANKCDTGAKIELLVHQEIQPHLWEALARPCRRLKPGTRLKVGKHILTVLSIQTQGRISLQFPTGESSRKILNQHGITPLPPYIRRSAKPSPRLAAKDRRRYQTIFAQQIGSVAAPTAGLHFSPGIKKKMLLQGISLMPITLHVGWGTFAPLPEGELSGYQLHPERYFIPLTTAQTIEKCIRQGGRIIACGTTVARALESAALVKGQLNHGWNITRLFIHSDYSWKIIDGLLTNFHLPGSSLLMLVCAWGGKDKVLSAYHEAIRQKYQFYSYGDAMLII